MLVYKAFEKDLSCTRGSGRYQYQLGVMHKTEEANCARNGFHCAADPLDCLTYYGNWDNSVYYLVQAGGDMNEDATDTRISCTELVLVKQLDLEAFVTHALYYMTQYPYRACNDLVKEEEGAAEYKFVIVRGKNPIARGGIGTVLGFAQEAADDKRIVNIGVYTINGQEFQPDIYYDLRGMEFKGEIEEYEKAHA